MSPLKLIATLFLLCGSIALSAQNLTIYRSSLSVDETTDKLVALIKESNLVYFETVFHDKLAKERDLEISPTRVVLFEDPAVVTRLISCNQTTALEVPLKMLIWEENNDVYLGFVDPKLMGKRFLLEGCDDTLDELARLMVKLANNVIRSS